MKEPISAIVFDVLGAIFWFAASIALYVEETAGEGAKMEGLSGIAEAARIIRQQGALLELACCAAVVGTLFFGFAAILKMQVRAVNALVERNLS